MSMSSTSTQPVTSSNSSLSPSTVAINSSSDGRRNSSRHRQLNRGHHRRDQQAERKSGSAAARKPKKEKLGVNDIGKHMHTHACSHLEDVKADEVESYQHLLEALYGIELAEQNQDPESAVGSDQDLHENSDEEPGPSRRIR